MSTEMLERRFGAISARVKLVRSTARGEGLLDVGVDRRGEYFELRVAGARGISMTVLDADRDDRALLLLVDDEGERSKFLCGFDERHWFVAAVPESARGVCSVATAKDALQPQSVREAVAARASKGSLQAQERGIRAPGRVVLPPAVDVAGGRARRPPE
jgi:hypothetical protein